MSNRLAREKSPYLLQHKENPIDWYPWGEEAFEKARREDKPIFLSIGYSTCHWCHVMERESFEDEEVARLVNEAFVPIKVDREERPDVDGVYMTVCQMMTGHGGWPLTILMTPDAKPFHAATYVPRESRFGRIGMLELVPRIQEVWVQRRQEVLDAAEHVTQALRGTAQPEASRETPGESLLHETYASLRERYDPVYGGFGEAPKFPSPHNLLFLLRFWKRSGRLDALEMVIQTLEKMRLGGIYDHLGYGFHRYSTDRRWLLPHFEKMLYDQALLAAAYTEAYLATGRDVLRQTAEEIFEYVRRDLQGPEGAFYSAEDADSEGREGTYYVWTVDEVREILDDADLFISVYNLVAEGNFEEEATRRRTGENVLYLSETIDEAAAKRADESIPGGLAAARKRLLEHRERRIRPGLDDKILTDWNGLMIAALAKAASAFGEEEYARAAMRATRFVLDRMRDESGRLFHRYRDGEVAVLGNLDDYAYFTWGLLELYEATFESHLLKTALKLTRDLIAHFWDDAAGGFFFAADDAEKLIVRRKEFYDGALPSGNAVAMLNLLRLSRITGDSSLEQRAEGIARAAGVSRMPAAFTGLLTALDFAVGPTREIVIAGESGADDSEMLVRAVREVFLPNKVVLFNPAGNGSDLAEVAPFVAQQGTIDGRSAAYVCRDFRCDRPVTTAADLRAALESG